MRICRESRRGRLAKRRADSTLHSRNGTAQPVNVAGAKLPEGGRAAGTLSAFVRGASYILRSPKSLATVDVRPAVGHTVRVVPATGAGSLRWAERQGSGMGHPSEGRLFGRRRRANVQGGRQHDHRVKVTPEEEAQLLCLAEAQHVTVPRLLVESALASAAGETPTERKQAMAELFALHRLLAAVSNNVNQIARATNATGEIQVETAATLKKAREVAVRIDQAIDGLGFGQ